MHLKILSFLITCNLNAKYISHKIYFRVLIYILTLKKPVFIKSINQKKKKIPINFITYYRKVIKLVPNINYCLLQFDALIFFRGRLHGVST